jgi:hypothetical protein
VVRDFCGGVRAVRHFLLLRVAQAVDFADATKTVGAPCFAFFAKGVKWECRRLSVWDNIALRPRSKENGDEGNRDGRSPISGIVSFPYIEPAAEG